MTTDVETVKGENTSIV